MSDRIVVFGGDYHPDDNDRRHHGGNLHDDSVDHDNWMYYADRNQVHCVNLCDQSIGVHCGNGVLNVHCVDNCALKGYVWVKGNVLLGLFGFGRIFLDVDNPTHTVSFPLDSQLLLQNDAQTWVEYFLCMIPNGRGYLLLLHFFWTHWLIELRACARGIQTLGR